MILSVFPVLALREDVEKAGRQAFVLSCGEHNNNTGCSGVSSGAFWGGGKNVRGPTQAMPVAGLSQSALALPSELKMSYCIQVFVWSWSRTGQMSTSPSPYHISFLSVVGRHDESDPAADAVVMLVGRHGTRLCAPQHVPPPILCPAHSLALSCCVQVSA